MPQKRRKRRRRRRRRRMATSLRKPGLLCQLSRAVTNTQLHHHHQHRPLHDHPSSVLRNKQAIWGGVRQCEAVSGCVRLCDAAWGNV